MPYLHINGIAPSLANGIPYVRVYLYPVLSRIQNPNASHKP
jgi:hypothetical protein